MRVGSGVVGSPAWGGGGGTPITKTTAQLRTVSSRMLGNVWRGDRNSEDSRADGRTMKNGWRGNDETVVSGNRTSLIRPHLPQSDGPRSGVSGIYGPFVSQESVWAIAGRVIFE